MWLQGRGGLELGWKGSQKGCLWRAALPLCLLHAKPSLSLLQGIREMTGAQILKYCVSFIAATPKFCISHTSKLVGLSTILGLGIYCRIPK